MEKQVAWGAGRPSLQGWLLGDQIGTEAYYGHLLKARALSKSAVEMATQTNAMETAADLLSDQALLEAEIGETARARHAAMEALATGPGRDVRVKTAWALARAGDALQAQTHAKNLEKEFSFNNYLRAYSIPTIRAAAEVQNGNPARAIEILRTIPFELGHTPGTLPNLYPIYVRGLAFLQAGDPRAAKIEFQKIIDHPGVVYSFIIGPLAHLQLARAQAMMGDKGAARKSYQEFLTLWKDADPDIPIYQQAKAEYARLP